MLLCKSAMGFTCTNMDSVIVLLTERLIWAEDSVIVSGFWADLGCLDVYMCY